MQFLSNIFGKEEPVRSYEDLWDWFRKREKTFFDVVRRRDNIERNFFDKLSPKLNDLADGLFLLAGMLDADTAELIITPDGNIKKFHLAENLVAAAPEIAGWKFTALKPESGEDFYIQMGGHEFGDRTLRFSSAKTWEYPDEIDITVVHESLTKENREAITNAVYIFIDNYLGECTFATTIDHLSVEGPAGNSPELRPIGELKEYLRQREAEFLEKYEGTRHNTENDAYSSFESKTKDGLPIVGIVNTSLLNWERKASHPWIAVIKIGFDGRGNNGMPDDDMYQLMNRIEDETAAELKDSEGYLNIGRQTGGGNRYIYLACKEFRKPSRVLDEVIDRYRAVSIEYDLFKDKYWRSFERFNPEQDLSVH
jgi:hypothetical protein